MSDEGLARYEQMKKRYEEEHSIKCPHCGYDYTEDIDFLQDLITYHGEDGPVKRECGECSKEFYVQEIVDRTYEVGKGISVEGEIHE